MSEASRYSDIAVHDVVVDEPAPGVVRVTLDRAAKRNAISDAMFDDFLEVQRVLAADDTARVVIITGSGVGFCAGLDLDLAEALPSYDTPRYLRNQERWAAAIVGFHRLALPVIAAVNGVAAGAGMGLALAADIRIADETARFNAAFVKIGLSAGDVGVSWLLPRIVGLGRSSEMLFTGRFVGAEEALRIGLVTEVVAPEALIDRALAVAATIVGNSPFGMRMTKQVIESSTSGIDLEAALAIENRTQTLATRTDDFAEAVSAFRERREPRFTGR